MLSSPAHRAALRFLRGGLVATVALLVPSQLGAWSRAWPALQPLIALSRVVIPALGFALGGLVGSTSLDRGRRGAAAFAVGLLATGVAVSFSAPLLQGLTGFENRWTVAMSAAASTGAAFALGGALAALVLDPGLTVVMTAGFAAGGAIGGVVAVAPSLLAPAVASWPPDARLFLRLACSLAGLLGPFAFAGAVAGKALERGTEN